MNENGDLRYPIGKPTFPDAITAEQRNRWIEEVAAIPQALREAISGLSELDLRTPYREGGWTLRQLVHHMADSHMNAYVRFKLALTEDQPTIKPYEEDRWAELADTDVVPVETSLNLLEALHERWAALMRSMGEAEWARGYHHPEQNRIVPLQQALGLYAWHGKHHTAHVTGLRQRNGW